MADDVTSSGANYELTFIKAGFDEVVKHVIATEGLARMTRVADACNAQLDRPGYLLSVQGQNPRAKRDYSMTVITVSDDAKYDNAKNNTLVRNFHLAGGQ